MARRNNKPSTTVSPAFASSEFLHPRLPAVKAVLIDWDGTLVYNRIPSNNIKREIIEGSLCDKIPDKRWKQIQDWTVANIFKDYYSRHPDHEETWRLTAKDRYQFLYIGYVTHRLADAIQRGDLTFKPEGLRTLQWLVESGIPVAIVGNAPKPLLDTAVVELTKHLIGSAHDFMAHIPVVGSQFHSKGKPHTDTALEALAMLEARAGKTIRDGIYVIGNSPVLELGMAEELRKEGYGVTSVLFNNEGKGKYGHGEGLALMARKLKSKRTPLKLKSEYLVPGQMEVMQDDPALGMPIAWKDCLVVDNHVQLRMLLEKAGEKGKERGMTDI